ncbi:unnamed protein product [Phytophthora fragariaefolia]|uniref:Unnamed protein product n=1 Tax=Phytophthora fragariaefolia TaxID=1490495 RepID=A0A9W6XZB0_9STRA|nr:unnamed protein product [Phytophthora fragariaefolia]
MQAQVLLEQHDVMCILVSSFDEFTANDIRQASGRTQTNAGEIWPSGVEKILSSTQPLDERDVLLNDGAGIGKILAQIALTTNVCQCIGVEVRGVATRCVGQGTDVYPLLRKVTMKAADVRDVLFSHQAPISGATVVFANYFLFEEAAKFGIVRELGATSKARIIASTFLFCPMNRMRCTQPFCARWKLAHKWVVECS